LAWFFLLVAERSVYPSLMRNMQALNIRVEQMNIALAYPQPLDM
jgi:hypothetical protein